MKKVFALVCLLLVTFSLAVIGFAHSGGTDSKGGHYNRSTGEYHYHHGYSAHQHPNGECPYEDNTSSSTTLFSLDDFDFEYESFIFVEPEYPLLEGYTLPEDDTTEEATTEESTESNYNSQHNTYSSNSSLKQRIWNAIDTIFRVLGSIVMGVCFSFTILLAFNSLIEIPDKVYIPTFIVISIILAIVAFFVVW